MHKSARKDFKFVEIISWQKNKMYALQMEGVDFPHYFIRSRKRQREIEQKLKLKKKLKLEEHHENLVRKMLQFVEDNKGEMPALHFAARVSNVDVCRRLVQQGADVNEKYGKLGATPLHFAALNTAHGDGLIDFFLRKGLWKRPYDRFAILKAACRYGDLEMVKWLLEEVEIDVNLFEEREKVQVLGQAAQESEQLFKRVANTKIKIERRMSLLQFCVMRNRLNAAKFVHAKDGDLINEINEDGLTVLHLAAMFGSVTMCRWLIDQGQNLYAINEKTCANFLHYAAQNTTNGEDIIKAFGKKLRGLVNQTAVKDFAPLHFAMINGPQHDKVAEALLELGADLSVKWNGNNLLHFCIIFRKLKCAKFVHGKDKNQIKEKGGAENTTLHLAANHFEKEMCAWLVKQGADPRELTAGGKSVLESTFSAKAKKFFRFIIKSKILR
ncbi:Hypothetical predicted protein [Cloeon dipterum]|uniref:Uncharacterized protein n=1 Tax=Cloeon dipterum TaxID=197152 RepID=A0A8S1E149_9INSE|nr:Hypothetical predicted protein [Cloeon dipterum]